MNQSHGLRPLGMIVSAVCPAFIAAVQAAPASAPWQQRYTGDEASGPQVIALWQFDGPDALKDVSGHGHHLTLRGKARIVPDGRFGGALESFPADKDNDHAQGAETPNAPDLTPLGAFTLDLWIRPKPGFEKQRTAFLIDKKYYHYAKDIPRANTAYCLYLVRQGGDKPITIRAYLGYGKDSAQYTSQRVDIPVGKWSHIAFTYDGRGTGRFFLDGEQVGRTKHEGRGSVAPGPFPLVIGDRVGSIHNGFDGYLDQVRLTRGIPPYFTGSLTLSAGASRTTFYRMEKDARVSLHLLNDTGKSVEDVVLTTRFLGREQRTVRKRLVSGEELVAPIAVPTDLSAGTYPLQARAQARIAGTDRNASTEMEVPIILVNRRLPHEMPVVMWGTGDLERLKDIGFTHHLTHMEDYMRIWRAHGVTESVSPDRIPAIAERLNKTLAEGVLEAVYLYPGHFAARRPEFQRYLRVGRNGKPYSRHNLSAGLPDMLEFGYNVGASVGRTFGAFPALDAALINSEVRDGTAISFHPYEREACRKACGFDIPPEATSKWGLSYASLPGFPPDRIIPDDFRLLRFYRWFWKDGDGWNPFHSRIHRGLKAGSGRTDIWTFFDPAVRAPSIWGSGGEVDVISQWTYTYPDPIKIGQAADELFAMAAGRPGQKVMKMTQIIWYRSQTAPDLPQKESDRAEWERRVPDARFITIAPDHLREAFWCMISRPVAGIMYHGWGSLVPAPHGAYRYTNPETKEVLKRLIHEIVRPLGPTLLQVPDRPADIAILESFTSQMFAGRGTWGWSGSWEADVHLLLQWAGYQPRIVYEETILRDGIDGIRVLVMPYCDVLPASVAERIRKFQDAGGLIVADENAAPAITPDILLPVYRRTGKPDRDKAALQERGRKLRAELAPFYTPYGESSSPDVVIRFRRYGPTDYLFVINDKRTFGTYVGHHRRVMEKGLPAEALITVHRPDGVVYELPMGRHVEVRAGSGKLQLPVTLGPGAGRLFMITPVPLARLQCEVRNERVHCGAKQNIHVRVLDRHDRPVPAVVPVQVVIRRPDGRSGEFSGWYGARDGILNVTLDIPSNAPPGRWRVEVRELAAGMHAESAFSVVQ